MSACGIFLQTCGNAASHWQRFCCWAIILQMLDWWEAKEEGLAIKVLSRCFVSISQRRYVLYVFGYYQAKTHCMQLSSVMVTDAFTKYYNYSQRYVCTTQSSLDCSPRPYHTRPTRQRFSCFIWIPQRRRHNAIIVIATVEGCVTQRKRWSQQCVVCDEQCRH